MSDDLRERLLKEADDWDEVVQKKWLPDWDLAPTVALLREAAAALLVGTPERAPDGWAVCDGLGPVLTYWGNRAKEEAQEDIDAAEPGATVTLRPVWLGVPADSEPDQPDKAP